MRLYANPDFSTKKIVERVRPPKNHNVGARKVQNRPACPLYRIKPFPTEPPTQTALSEFTKRIGQRLLTPTFLDIVRVGLW